MAQTPYSLLRQTSTTGRSSNTAATTSNSNASYYQPRAGQTDGYGFGGVPPTAASYMAYYTQPAGPSGPSVAGGSGYHQISTNPYPAGPSSSLVASTSSSTAPGTSARGPSMAVASTSPAFRAPAHKHAHHLHSIPPREKSTRTLIIDHMLWAHGMTRFAQARAELGMTDQTGGPTSSHYAHRTRPEEYEEEDEVGSEGEESRVLKARGVGTNDRSEEIRLSKQDLVLARTLRLRAEGLEKVVTSMLDQPPPEPQKPPADEHYSHHHHYHHHHHHSHSHWQKYEVSPNTRTGKHPHTLPNGVRLRLALGTIINDLFARQVPHLPYRHSHPTVSDDHNQESHPSPPPSTEETVTSSVDNLPEALLPLVRVSGAFASKKDNHHQRSGSVQSQTSNLVYTPQSSPYQSFASTSPLSNHNPPVQQYQQHQQQYHTGPSPFMVPGLQIYAIQPPHSSPPPPPPPQVSTPRPRGPVVRPTPSQRVLSLYTSGVNAHTDGSSRCPRHLQTRCDICVEAKSPTGRTGSGSGGGRSKAFVISSGGPSSMGSLTTIGGVGRPPAGISGWRDGSGVGTGLLKHGPRGSVLRRKTYLGTEDHHASSSTPSGSGTATPSGDPVDDRTIGAGNTKLARLIPRFIKLSALVAGELGREVRGEEVEDSSSTPIHSHAPGSPASSIRTRRRRQQHQKMYDYALKPTKEWYLLLAGLLTRAVLEGYFTAGWRGVEATECLLLLGLGINVGSLEEANPSAEEEEDEEEVVDSADVDDDEAKRKREKLRKWKKRRKALELFDEDEEFSEFHPDEYPSLFEALRVLFPSLRHSSSSGLVGSGGTRSRKGKGKAEAEYEAEMFERLRRFYDIPASTLDLTTHMEDLAWQYPAEPVERAAVRFCEAVAKWRGKPELGTYKKISQASDKTPSQGGSSSNVDPLQGFFEPELSIESLVHSNPTSPTMGNVSTGSLAGALGPYGITQRKKLKKPSVDMYFLVRDGGRGNSQEPGAPGRRRKTASLSPTFKRKRLEGDDDGRDGGFKRVHT
ncbi:hypothetical protein BKA70DRAFT_1096335 [Coprinopsis sp. MPI-PUGE-AT-0042]|nr:hypothetical protein BKA70DRAFT_1096335 [Coprinopsis sp. MPI-PUGE-AT-0042]